MDSRPSRPPRARWIGLAALGFLLVGLAVGARLWRHPHPASSPALTPPVADVIGEALEAARVDSAAIKRRWIDDVRGIDLTRLDPPRRELFLRYANAERCTCGCGYTLAGCRATDMSCEISGPHLDALLDSVRAGRITSARGLRARPGGGG
jgi:hypothetical protein